MSKTPTAGHETKRNSQPLLSSREFADWANSNPSSRIHKSLKPDIRTSSYRDLLGGNLRFVFGPMNPNDEACLERYFLENIPDTPSIQQESRLILEHLILAGMDPDGHAVNSFQNIFWPMFQIIIREYLHLLEYSNDRQWNDSNLPLLAEGQSVLTAPRPMMTLVPRLSPSAIPVLKFALRGKCLGAADNSESIIFPFFVAEMKRFGSGSTLSYPENQVFAEISKMLHLYQAAGIFNSQIFGLAAVGSTFAVYTGHLVLINPAAQPLLQFETHIRCVYREDVLKKEHTLPIGRKITEKFTEDVSLSKLCTLLVSLRSLIGEAAKHNLNLIEAKILDYNVAKKAFDVRKGEKKGQQ
ncbi:hypothetical protein NEOLI_003966 [Neolecta irregularis DAH-3]|uniref:Uncharacterized protein n=1 Tax=Neolecta irregularis (strain DAH-3) TaxID=1198029 RepID=A0A1U7LUS6_NEOID|nr:hypothetical protein NEOLI_003966 [Neolecta irregularis DAH-3]|eukprot:OLL26379.1 hypothetical protein NEOLI_003966 [Neolecta irregularis DAH-3]